MTDLPAKAYELLKSVFGYETFRPGQAEVIGAVLDGDPVLAVMPTGSGKSMCYQLPALMDDGLTLVVSPLIALMRDQVQQMRSLGVAAGTLNSSNNAQETADTWAALKAVELRLLFLSPERLAMDGLHQALRRAGVRRIAIDEAHCVSEWGHDFRPEYRQIRTAVEAMGNVQVIAFTATADRNTRDDIVGRLFDSTPKVFVHSFDRPNLDLRFAAKDQPRRQLEAFLSTRRGQSGIVYCSSRDRTEKTAEWLNASGFEAVPYHAGLDQNIRARNQDRFLQEDGIVVAATIAFGMGINKPDVRFVAHADMPGSVEAYYQEIGRAGRDGLPASTLTLYGVEDMALRRRQIAEKPISDERRRIENERFGRLAMLCEASSCRRQVLLAYFDEPSAPCGSCDICRGEVSLYDGTIDAQKVLSAVYRTGQRFGAGYLADVLTGEATDAIRRNGHDLVKTFGVGKDRAKQAWSSIIRQLFAAEAVATASTEHGGFCLTEKGQEILLGRETVRLRTEAPKAPRARSRDAKGQAEQEGLDEADATLFGLLRKKRLEIARSEGVEAYVVFADRTLLEIARKRPSTLQEMAGIHGIGASKLDRYGDAFLEVLDAAG
ncbi:MAG: ATP-dependent helicase RecQ [Hyphomicrobiales bacterium]|nr:ATP-dependent helicase RecQ [Hyphomicrobiales bacterium]